MQTLKEFQLQLKEEIKAQFNACDVLSIIIYKYLLRLYGRDFGQYFTSPLVALILGRTGVGKTHLIKTAASLLGCAFIEIDAKSIVQEGWHGQSFQDQFNTKLKNFEKGVGGILLIDEFDKICVPLSSSTSENVNKHIQNSLLTYFEGANFTGTKINLNNFLVLLGGAFEGIKFNEPRTIGFEDSNNTEIHQNKALITYGMLPELVGRISEIIKLEDLEEVDFLNILESENFIYRKYQEILFKLELDFTFKAGLIKQAMKKELGVRGLIQEVELELTKFLLNNDINLNYLEAVKDLNNQKRNRW